MQITTDNSAGFKSWITSTSSDSLTSFNHSPNKILHDYVSTSIAQKTSVVVALHPVDSTLMNNSSPARNVALLESNGCVTFRRFGCVVLLMVSDRTILLPGFAPAEAHQEARASMGPAPRRGLRAGTILGWLDSPPLRPAKNPPAPFPLRRSLRPPPHRVNNIRPTSQLWRATCGNSHRGQKLQEKFRP